MMSISEFLYKCWEFILSLLGFFCLVSLFFLIYLVIGYLIISINKFSWSVEVFPIMFLFMLICFLLVLESFTGLNLWVAWVWFVLFYSFLFWSLGWSFFYNVELCGYLDIPDEFYELLENLGKIYWGNSFCFLFLCGLIYELLSFICDKMSLSFLCDFKLFSEYNNKFNKFFLYINDVLGVSNCNMLCSILSICNCVYKFVSNVTWLVGTIIFFYNKFCMVEGSISTPMDSLLPSWFKFSEFPKVWCSDYSFEPEDVFHILFGCGSLYLVLVFFIFQLLLSFLSVRIFSNNGLFNKMVEEKELDSLEKYMFLVNLCFIVLSFFIFPVPLFWCFIAKDIYVSQFEWVYYYLLKFFEGVGLSTDSNSYYGILRLFIATAAVLTPLLKSFWCISFFIMRPVKFIGRKFRILFSTFIDDLSGFIDSMSWFSSVYPDNDCKFQFFLFGIVLFILSCCMCVLIVFYYIGIFLVLSYFIFIIFSIIFWIPSDDQSKVYRLKIWKDKYKNDL